MLTYCVLFSGRVGVRVWIRIIFSVWLVRRYAHVSVLLSVVVVTLPVKSMFTAVMPLLSKPALLFNSRIL